MPQVTGCEIETGLETFTLQGTWFSLIVSRDDLAPPVGPVAKFCFQSEVTRDRFAKALRNMSQGRAWNDEGSADDDVRVDAAQLPEVPNLDSQLGEMTEYLGLPEVPVAGAESTPPALIQPPESSLMPDAPAPEPQPEPTDASHSAIPPESVPLRMSQGEKFGALARRYQLPFALQAKELGPDLELLFPEISSENTEQLAMEGWIAVLDHLGQPRRIEAGRDLCLREIANSETGQHLREALRVSAEQHAAANELVAARRTTALGQLFARHKADPTDDVAAMVESIRAPFAAECTVELEQLQLPSPVDGTFIVRIEAETDTDAVAHTRTWLSAPAYAKAGLARWDVRGSKMRIPAAVRSVRIFCEPATPDGRPLTGTRRGMKEVQVTPTDPLSVEPQVLEVQDVAGMDQSDSEVELSVSKDDGKISCSQFDTGWRLELFQMGVTSITVRDNVSPLAGVVDIGTVYKHAVDVETTGERAAMLIFTDSCGETYTLQCVLGGLHTMKFNSQDPTIRKVSTCALGAQGLKARAAALSSDASLTAESEWYPGKNLLRLAKGASDALLSSESGMSFGGSQITIKLRYWERTLLDAVPEPCITQIEFDEARELAQQMLQEQNRSAAEAQLDRAEKLKSKLVEQPLPEPPQSELFQMMTGKVVSWYVERAARLGEGQDIASDVDEVEAEFEDEDDDFVALSHTVSDQEVALHGGSAAESSSSPAAPRSSSTVFEVQEEIRTEGQQWPLATIVPWRVQFLLADIAVETGVSEDQLWLCQISGLLRAFPTTPGMVYMKALQGMLRGYFASSSTEESERLGAAVLSVAEHCILWSVRHLWRSYPQGDADVADSHLDALQCGLQTLQQLTLYKAKQNEEEVSDHQMTAQLEGAIGAAAATVGECLAEVRNGDHFVPERPAVDDAEEEDWEVVSDDGGGDIATKDADELRQKMRELVKATASVCDAVCDFVRFYAQVFEADSGVQASVAFAGPLYAEIWSTVEHIVQIAKPSLHVEDMEKLFVSCTRLDRCLGATAIELRDVPNSFDAFVSAGIDHCATRLHDIAESAIQVDQFEPLNSEQPCSSSIVDVLRACIQSIQPLQYFLWSPKAAVRMMQKLGTVLFGYVNLMHQVCVGYAGQLGESWAQANRPFLATGPRTPREDREEDAGKLLRKIFAQINNLFYAHQQLAELGEKVDTLHSILLVERPDGWHDFVLRTKYKSWDTNIEQWDGDRTQWRSEPEPEPEPVDEGELKPVLSTATTLSQQTPAAVADAFLHQCLSKYRDGIGELVNGIGDNLRRKLVEQLEQMGEDEGEDPCEAMLSWLETEALAAAEECLFPPVFRRVVRGLHWQCIAQLELILLGEELTPTPDQATYERQVGCLSAAVGAITEFFGDGSGGTATSELVERIGQLTDLHGQDSEELSSLCEQGAVLPEGTSVSDVRRVLAMRRVHDSAANDILQEMGFSSAVRPPEGFDLPLDETVLGKFDCWFPSGALYVCTGHLLYEPKRVFVDAANRKIAYSEIRFIKKQKMTGVGSDNALEIGLDGEVLCFRGFVRPSGLVSQTRLLPGSGQAVRDSCHALICKQALDSCGNNLESAEAGAWPELRRMFGLPASETLIDQFSCHYVVHGTKERHHTNEGTLYVTQSYLCFHSYFFGVRRSEVIPLQEVAQVETSSYPLLVPNAIDIHTTAASQHAETLAMNRRTFFGFGFGTDRQLAYETIGLQRLRCRGGDAQPVGPPVIYLLAVICHGDALATPLCCVLTGANGDSGERTLGPAADKDFAVECTDLGELTGLRIWPADETYSTMAPTYERTLQGQVTLTPPRLTIERVAVQCRSRNRSGTDLDTTSQDSVHSVALFTPYTRGSAHYRRGPLELTRDSDSDAFRHATAASMSMEAVEEVYENQRRPAFSFKPTFSSAELTPIERGAWSDDLGRPRIKRNVALPVGWTWATDWSVDMEGACDSDGWRYAFNWPREFSLAKEYYPTANKPIRCFVRRRRWIRVRRRQAASPRLRVTILEAKSLPPPPENRNSFVAQPRPVCKLSLGSAEHIIPAPPPDGTATDPLATSLRWADGATHTLEVTDAHFRESAVVSVDIYHSSNASGDAQLLHSDPLLCSVRLPVEAIVRDGGLASAANGNGDGGAAGADEAGTWFACEAGGGEFLTRRLTSEELATAGAAGDLASLAPNGCVRLRIESLL